MPGHSWTQFDLQNDLKSVFLEVTSTQQDNATVRNIFIFLDALDEWDENDRKNSSEFEFFENLVQKDVPLKICSSTRPRSSPTSRGSVIEMESHNSEDIGRYLQKTIGGRHMKDTRRRVLIENLSMKANHNFMWLVLVVWDLDNWPTVDFATTENILKRIQKIPKELKALYDEILERLARKSDDAMREESYFLLQLIAFAKEALSLQEVMEAISILIYPDTWQSQLEHFETLDFAACIRTWSRGLVEVIRPGSQETPGPSIVQFAHTSIHRLLVDHCGLKYFDPAAQDPTTNKIMCHYRLFELCVKYLERDTLAQPGLKLHQYVMSFWMEHARNSGERMDAKQFVFPGFLKKCNAITKNIVLSSRENMIRRSNMGKFRGCGSITYEERLICLLAAEGCTQLLVVHRGCTLCYGTTTALGEQESMLGSGCALLQAAEHNRVQTVQYLVRQLNCDVNFRGGEINTTPLCQAVRSGSVDMVKALLDLGAKVDVCAARTFKSPLNTAVGYNDVTIAKILLNHPGVDRRRLLCQPDMYGQYALHIAAYHGLASMVETLCEPCERDEIGYILDLSDRNGETAYMVAVRKGHDTVAAEILKRLLDS
ncbi:uncharacterized protein CCOS01_06058 [Colletotrichum costaricense]|uniref:Ankyrin repeat protein n=1 Tax=Colletotrichum costaricense TaxID=1209916 RepID=A0AAJ0E3Y5_9PEZI|nr:uncharacterized protein CCOS01_06058 [Colletotrichum costaricense]KAK1530955.1 hypothetical protein CCOS01_06058 [Colletotrichum costaricense]